MGGLENGLVNLINRTPPERYRHAVICLTGYDRFAERITRGDVAVYGLDKREGKDPGAYWRLWRLLRRIRPAIVHTRNLAALEGQLPAYLAGVPCRIHGEHGWDVQDLSGDNDRYLRLRRLLRVLVHRYIPVSGELEVYLRDRVRVPRERVTRITNGVDVQRFHPRGTAGAQLRRELGWPRGTWIVGWVGRMEAVKNPLGLVASFQRLWHQEPTLAGTIRLALIGSGSQYEEVAAAVVEAGLEDRVWLPGARDDVPDLLRAMDLFVLPSLAEGICNTVLEALACGVPVIATAVGGNRELVVPGVCGRLVPPDDPDALAAEIAAYLRHPRQHRRERFAARARILRGFSVDKMVAGYLGVYDDALAKTAPKARSAGLQGEAG